jgi:integrase
MKGLIICNKCRKKMDGVCQCGSYKCLIKIYWKGRDYEYRRDEQGYIFTYDKAVDKLSEIATAIKKGTFNPVDFTDAKVQERKFSNQIELWRQEKKEEFDNGELSPEHYQHIESYLKNYYSYFKNYDVREIDLEKLSEFKRNCIKYKKGTKILLKSKTQKNILNSLHAFFTWLKKQGMIKEIPSFPEIKRYDKTRRVALTRDAQGQGLLNIPEAHRDPFVFMMNTGVRPGELIAILRKSVDIDNRAVWIERRRSGSQYREGTKNNEVLPVPLNDIALEIVARNIKGKFPNDFLFINPGTGRGYTRWFLWDMWKRLSGTDVCLYEACRHSFCTQIVPLTDRLTAQRLMRHKDGRSTDNYYHAYSETLLDVVQKMGKVVDLQKAKNGKIEPK